MTSRRNYCLLILVLASMLFPIPFTRVITFSPFQVPDVFESFSWYLWPSLHLLSASLVLICKGCVNIDRSSKNSFLPVFATIYIWLLFYVIPAFVNYPLLWKSTEEQVLFAKSLMYGTVSRNQGWPASYILLIMLHQLLDFDILFTAPLLAAVLNFLVPLTIFLLSRKFAPKYAFLAPLLFALPQTYYYRFFSDYLYGFSLFLILVYLMCWSDGRAKALIFIAFFTSLTIGHPLTSLVYIILFSLYVFSEFIKFRDKGLFGTLTLIILIFASWYLYNELAFQAVSPYIVYISKMEHLAYIQSPQAYFRTPFHESLPYIFLYTFRYLLFALLGITSLLGLLVMIRRREARKTLILLSLILSSLLPWLIIKASSPESFDNRFMVFGTLPVALASTYAIATKLRRMTYVVLMLLPISFALAFFPSTFMLFAHEFEFRGGEFVAYHSLDNTIIITDEYSANFIALYNPYTQPLGYISDVTIFNKDPVAVYIPASPNTVLRSLRQDIQAFISHRRDPTSFLALDQRLSESHNVVYDSRYITVWSKT